MKQLQFNYQIENALTPLDGRNRHKVVSLIPYFSELALNKYRIFEEVEYIKKLSSVKVIRTLTPHESKLLDSLSSSFGSKDYQKLRNIESVVNHDMQAVVVFIQNNLKSTSLKDISPMVHFGLTSEDANNIAYALMITKAMEYVIIPELKQIEKDINQLSRAYKNTVMLGRTHGQVAAPTTYGKELAVFKQRLSHELRILDSHKLKAKLNGNVGNFNAHTFIYPTIDWPQFSRNFIVSLGLTPDLVTTQIEPYDSFIFLFQTLSRINNILEGMCKDLWLYASLGYCKQKTVNKEVGSSSLPHKVNPIYLEGAEGGFGIANALYSFYAEKLSYSRLQRDLSDSTVRRSFAIAFSYSLLSYQSLREGLKRIAPNKEKMNADLNNHFEVLSEAVQNMLRSRGYENAYEQAKTFFHGKNIIETEYKHFVEQLGISKEDIKLLINLTPATYTGVAQKLVI